MSVVPKAKRRNSEKRKEHSRDAARCRRSREAEVFLHLAQEIPLAIDVVKLLDKTSIIRLTITYLKLRALNAVGLLEKETNFHRQSEITHLEQKLDHVYHRALDGFLMVVASDGDILFVTDNVTCFLGLTQIDVMGHSIFDLSHPCDHEEIRDAIGAKSHHQPDDQKTMFVRMKSTITSKGRSVNIKSASYKVISCTSNIGSLLSNLSMTGRADEMISASVIIGQSIAHPSSIDVPLDSGTFMSRHGLDMKFTDCDKRVSELIGYDVSEMNGKSVYLFHHALDAETLEKAFKTLFCKGQASTGLYRFLVKGSGYTWVETHATVINNAVTDKPEHVVCVNYVVSGVECKDTVFDSIQVSCKSVVSKEECIAADDDDDEIMLRFGYEEEDEEDEDGDQSGMQFATEKILAQAVMDRDDSESDSAMIHPMNDYLLDPSMESCEQSLYMINKSMDKIQDNKFTNEIGSELDDLGMTKNLSNCSLSSLLAKMEDGIEMRAPYISTEDLVFSSSIALQPELITSESHLGSLMDSDAPLMTSAGCDRQLTSEVVNPIFTLNPSDILPVHTSANQKQSTLKRPHGGVDAIDLTVVPSKAPRLDLDDHCPSVLRFSAPVNSHVTMTSSPAICAQPLAANGQQSAVKQTASGYELNIEQQVKYLEATKPVEMVAGENSVDVGVDRSSATNSGPMYVVWNGRQMMNQAKSALPLSEAKTSLVSDGKTGASEGGNFVLDLTNSCGRVLKMVDAGCNLSVPLVYDNIPVGTTFLDANGGRKTVIYTFGKSNGSQSQAGFRGDGQPNTGGHLGYQDSVLRSGLTGGSHVPRLVKTMPVLPTPKMITPVEEMPCQSDPVTDDIYCQPTGSFDQARRLVVNTSGSKAAVPLHLKSGLNVEPGGNGSSSAWTRGSTAYLKTLQLNDNVKNAMKSSAQDSTLLSSSNGIIERPLHLLQQGNTVSNQGQKPTGSVAQQATVLTAGRQQNLSVSNAQAIGNGQPLAAQQVAAVKGISLQRAAVPRTDNCAMVRQGIATESLIGSGYSQMADYAGSDAGGSSVLMNLLMKGIDVNYGYRLLSRPCPDGKLQG